MSAVLESALDYIAATARWSDNAHRIYAQGTLWYGTMCRSFLLLERMLRLSLAEVSSLASSEIAKAAQVRANGKPLQILTFGQCLGVLEEIAPVLPAVLANRRPDIKWRPPFLSESDRMGWDRVISMRNRMAHKGPGFLDSVDLRAGRVWREYTVQEPLDQQAKEIWDIGRQLCRSRFVLASIELQGCDEKTAIARLAAAEAKQFTLNELSSISEGAINAFHAA